METEACEATCCAVAFTDHSPDCELHPESSAASHRDVSDRKGSDTRGPSGVHERQAATMSPEAREFLRNQRSMLMPASAYTETASPAQVPACRSQFQAQEDIIEEKLIAEHDLLLEDDTIAGVPVLAVRPPETAEGMRGKAVFNLFFENSTRTRTTFEIAAKRLSADVINLNIGVSSTAKGETLLDTIDNLVAMNADMFIVRHGQSGAPHLIAQHLSATTAGGKYLLTVSGYLHKERDQRAG